MKYTVILFDLDGTLTDTVLGVTNGIKYALAKFGIREDDHERLVSFIGAPLFLAFQEQYSLSEDEARQAIAFYREYYSETGIFETTVYQGIPALLEHLKNSGKRLIVATLKPTFFAEKVLKNYDLRKYFEDVFGPDLKSENLTKTDIIANALAELPEVPKGQIVMVGDRSHDITGAARNGIDSIAVTYGFGTTNELQESGPTYVAASAEELHALLVQPI
jgi:phosphoglycolate phosphatase